MNRISDNLELLDLIVKYYIKFDFDRYEYTKILVVDKNYPGLIAGSLIRDTLSELLIAIVYRAKEPIVNFTLCPIVIKNNKLIQGLNILEYGNFNLNNNMLTWIRDE